MRFQREVAGVEQHHLGVGQVAPVGLGAGRHEEGVVPPPDREERRTMPPEVGLEGRAERDVAAVVEDEVELDLIVAMQRGESDTFAETALRWLSLHLVSRFGGEDGDGRRAARVEMPSDARLARAVETMTADLTSPIAVADLAREAGVSSFHFARLFARRMDVSPHAYLTRCRIEKARTLLATIDLPVAAVAAACGYATPGSFGANFLRHVGQTPGEARKGSRR